VETCWIVALFWSSSLKFKVVIPRLASLFTSGKRAREGTNPYELGLCFFLVHTSVSVSVSVSVCQDSQALFVVFMSTLDHRS